MPIFALAIMYIYSLVTTEHRHDNAKIIMAITVYIVIPIVSIVVCLLPEEGRISMISLFRKKEKYKSIYTDDNE